MLSPKQHDTKRRRTLENLAMRKLAERKAHAGAKSADGAARRVPFGAIDVNIRGVATTALPAHVPARHAAAAAPPAPRASAPEDVMMDADFCCTGDGDDDMDFGAQESFGEWLSRVGLTRVTPTQRAELERVWGDASEVETLRELVENLKDGELEMARREQLAASGWAADFERATETAWRERVEAASAAESEAKAELQRNAAAADAARAAASEEGCAAAAAAVEIQPTPRATPRRDGRRRNRRRSRRRTPDGTRPIARGSGKGGARTFRRASRARRRGRRS